MTIKTSFSQNSTYIKCPMHWKWKYVDKLDANFEGASLHFGSAIDGAVMDMLENKGNFITKFSDRWFSTVNKNKEYYQIYDNPTIVFSNYDFDKDVLEPEDLESMTQWLQELNLLYDVEKPVAAYNQVVKRKKSPYVKITNNELRYFNRCSWLSLQRKGILLLELFKKEFIPRITKLHATQNFYQLKDEYTGDILMGALDFVVELEGYDKPIIIDLKTASKAYTKESIDLSEQLPIYIALSNGKFNTNLVGYAVLIKNIEKQKASKCVKCGHVKKGLHKTCDNDINGTRCFGAWKEKVVLKPQMQVIIEEKTEDEVNKVLLDCGAVVEAMKNNIVYRNVQQCTNWFGSKCPYYDACHNDDLSGLKNRY